MGDAALVTDLDAIIAGARAIVFDWNGTLVDDADRALTATNRVLAIYGFAPLNPAEFSARFKLPLHLFMRELGIADAEIVDALNRWNLFLAQDATRLQPGTVGLLRAAQRAGLAIGVVSAAMEAAVRSDAVALGIDQYLSFIVGSAADKIATLTEIAACTTGPMLYIGDTEYDMVAAHVAGAIPVGYSRGYRPHAALLHTEALAVIDDFEVLTASLNRRRA